MRILEEPYFDIVRIIEAKQPKAFFLENVQHLLKHDEGKTFAKIQEVLKDQLGYSFYYKIVRASDFGLPQHRPRLFMVGFKNDNKRSFTFPNPLPLKTTMSDIFDGVCNKKIGYTLRVGGKGSGINDRRNWDSYLVNNELRRIKPTQALLMQGFPSSFCFPVSENQALKQLGNAVAIAAVETVARQIVIYLQTNES